MARLDNVKRIIVEDFPEEDQETIERLAQTLNFFMEQVVNTVNGNLDFENLNRELKTLEVTVDANGVPIQTTKFSTESTIQGLMVVSATNFTNTAVVPTSQPFVSFVTNSNSLATITRVFGLQANNKYRLTLELIY